MKKLLVCIGLGVIILGAAAQNTVIRGEFTPGVYPNVSVDSLGVIKTSPNPFRGTLTDRSGTITTGGSSQLVLPINLTRRYLFVQNVSDTTMWCNFTTAANTNQPSFTLIANASFIMENESISTEAINCTGTVTGKAFTAKEM